ncbi:MAG: hypothetical protein EHV01_003485 [Spiroplasma sp. hy2]|uniref:hypothetical protein n=1 Tax=Spiroplasma sp. hy2 TaxID=2490850 RepID=UPI0038468ACC
MKKLLSLLSVLTISGTAVPTTIAASPYQKEETIKNSNINLQTNNLENLKRNKRAWSSFINNLENINEAERKKERDRYIKNNYKKNINELDIKEWFAGGKQFFASFTPNFWEEIICLYDNNKNIKIEDFGIKFNNIFDKQENNIIDDRIQNNKNYSDINFIGRAVFKNWNKINDTWQKSTKKQRIRINGELESHNIFSSWDANDNYKVYSINIRDDEEYISNKYLKITEDFNYEWNNCDLSDSNIINLYLTEDDSNYFILNKIKEMFPKIDILQFEVTEKTLFTFLSKEFSAKIKVKDNSNIYPAGFQKKIIFMSKKFLEEDLAKILRQENLIQNWNSNFNEWKNEINRQKMQDLPKYGNDERGQALKRTWKGNHLSELKNKLLSLNHILETIDNKFKINELYKTVQGLQKDIDDLKQQISQLNQKIDNIKTDLEGNKNLETCTKTGALISATTGWIPVVGTLVSAISGTVSAICDIANT